MTSSLQADHLKTSTHASRWPAGLAILISAALVFSFWYGLDERWQSQVRRGTGNANEFIAGVITTDLEHRNRALQGVARRWSAGNGMPRAIWEADAATLYNNMVGFISLTRVDADLRVQWAYPAQGNEAIIGLDLGKVETAREPAAQAIRQGKLIYSKPVELVQGGLGILAFVPVSKNGQFDGLLTGAMPITPWLSSILLRGNSQQANYLITVVLEGVEVFRSLPESQVVENNWTVERSFASSGLQWTLAMTPSGARLSTIRPVSNQLVLFGGALGSALIGWVVFLVTKARVRERQLRATTQRLSGLLEALPGMAYQCELAQGWPALFVSNACLKLTGYAKAEFESRQVLWGDLIHPDDRERCLQAAQTARDTGTSFEVEYRLRTRAGEERWVWASGAVATQTLNGIHLLDGIVTDVSERKLTERKLTEASSFSRAVVESAIEAVITIDRDGRIENINPVGQQMFGRDIDDLKGQSFGLLFTDSCGERFDRLIRQYLQAGPGEAVASVREASGRRADGQPFPVHVSISSVEGLKARHCVAMVRDMTVQRAAETEANEHREHLAHIARTNALGEMASGIAHEINQPLTAISLFAQAGKRLLRSGQHERLPDILDKLSQHAQRAGAVMERMQIMARRGERERDLIDCADLINEVAMLAEIDARARGVALILEPEAGLPLVSVDAVQVQQVILNLIRNGMQAMESIDYRHGRAIVLRAAQEANGAVRIDVVDCGGGVPGGIADDLFTPFSTTKQSGIGMGLSICRAIVNAQGGRLSFRNNQAGGATFSFTLPAANQVTEHAD